MQSIRWRTYLHWLLDQPVLYVICEFVFAFAYTRFRIRPGVALVVFLILRFWLLSV